MARLMTRKAAKSVGDDHAVERAVDDGLQRDRAADERDRPRDREEDRAAEVDGQTVEERRNRDHEEPEAQRRDRYGLRFALEFGSIEHQRDQPDPEGGQHQIERVAGHGDHHQDRATQQTRPIREAALDASWVTCPQERPAVVSAAKPDCRRAVPVWPHPSGRREAVGEGEAVVEAAQHTQRRHAEGQNQHRVADKPHGVPDQRGGHVEDGIATQRVDKGDARLPVLVAADR